MTEIKSRFNPENGKPNPMSIREFHLLDRKEMHALVKTLSLKEKKDLYFASVKAWEALPLKTRREIQGEYIAKLEKQEKKSIADKVRLFQEKLYLKHLMLPERKPIFLRKLHSKEFPWPKWMKEKKSPYLMAS